MKKIGVKAGTKDMRDLVKRFKPGYQLVSRGHSKFGVVGPNGELVRKGGGMPLVIDNSPIPSHRFVYEKRLRQAGVIE